MSDNALVDAAIQEFATGVEDLAGASCRVCGCTAMDACVGGCSWIRGEGNLCSVCGRAVGYIVKIAQEIDRLAPDDAGRLEALNALLVTYVGWMEAAHTPGMAALLIEVANHLGPVQRPAAEAAAVLEPRPVLFSASGQVIL